ncbi:hypothetical protein JXA56_03875 [Candidatus Micrarchaeota archaeon]|nr:hypothetical protein [Candidatus Micrarchaeota archaeon]
MNWKTLFTIFGALIISAGLVAAITGATIDATPSTNPRWTASSGANDSLIAGDVKNANISSSSLTDKWASYYGQVSGSIVLADASSKVYTWGVGAANAGEVCLSQNTSYDFTGAQAGSASTAANTAWGYGSATDSINATYTGTAGSITLNSPVGTISNLANVTLINGFVDVILGNTASSAKSDFAFCTNINPSGVAVGGVAADYEIMVPVDGNAAETYAFFVELN